MLILDAEHSQTNPQRINANHLVTYRIPDWSPSGGQLVLGPSIVDLVTQEACLLPESGFHFVGSGEVAGRLRNPVRLAFYDSGCRSTRNWDLGPPDDWRIDDAWPTHGILIGRLFLGTGRLFDSLMNPQTEQATARFDVPWNAAGPYRIDGKITDGGASLCGVRGPEGRRVVFCRQMDSGRDIAYKKNFYDVDVQPARNSKRVVLSESARKFDWGDFHWNPDGVKNRTVWDFGRDEVLVSWQPKVQDLNETPLPNGRARPQPYAFAISPSGEYLVEGGADRLTLYRIIP